MIKNPLKKKNPIFRNFLNTQRKGEVKKKERKEKKDFTKVFFFYQKKAKYKVRREANAGV